MATVRISPDKTDHTIALDYDREAARHDATSQGAGPGGPGRAGVTSVPRCVNA
jgi:hypothetical protein